MKVFCNTPKPRRLTRVWLPRTDLKAALNRTIKFCGVRNASFHLYCDGHVVLQHRVCATAGSAVTAKNGDAAVATDRLSALRGARHARPRIRARAPSR